MSEVCCRREEKESVVPGLGSLRDHRYVEEEVEDAQRKVKQESLAFKVRGVA